ncbi:MAG: hypothetical protein WBC98_11300 [Candidatus Zixiibacteriota bacterium]
MKVQVVDKKGRAKTANLSKQRIVLAALAEVLKAHDYLYKKNWTGTPAKPSWDIAAKNARRVYRSLKAKEPLPRITICEEFI